MTAASQRAVTGATGHGDARAPSCHFEPRVVEFVQADAIVSAVDGWPGPCQTYRDHGRNLMMKKLVTVCALVAGMASAAVAQTTGTTNMDILRQKIKADKKLVVASNLKLTDTEGAAFWPVYDAYQKDLQQVNQRLAAVVVAYADAYNKGPVTNDMAKKLLDEAIAVDDAEGKLKASYVPKILATLPATKAARYIQIENKIRAAIRYELAEGIPLVE